MPAEMPTTGVRLDVWLWAARFHKTRSLARQAVATGKIDVGGQRAKPARQVRIGDTLRIDKAGEVFEVEVRGLSDSRGPATVARTLYEESEASRRRAKRCARPAPPSARAIARRTGNRTSGRGG